MTFHTSRARRRHRSHCITSCNVSIERSESLEDRLLLAADGVADVILTNGVIYTVDGTNWQANAVEALAIDDDQIMALGSNAEVLSLRAAGTQVLDLQGKTVLPGFHDAHTHILEAYSSVNTVPLAAETPLRSLLPSLQGQQPHAATGWVLGGGQTIEQFFELTENPKDILDEAIPVHPAAMLEQTSHSIWVNTAALTAAGITNSTPNPPGGIIDRDPDTGEASGLLIDSAVDLILDVALAGNAALNELNYQGLLEGLAAFNKFGVTSVADARIYDGRGQLDVWKRTETEGTISVRANLGLWASPYANDAQQIAALTALYSDDDSKLIKVNEVKLYSDGITSNGTSAFVDPYTQEGFGGPNGLKYFETARLQNYITQLEQVGFTFNIHAIGDLGVRDALTAIEGAGVTNSTLTDRRHRLTHVESVHPTDIARFESLGVIADFQVGGEILKPENREFERELIGNRADRLLPVKEVYDTGATVVFSSDFDVNSPSPFVGIESAVTRTDGQALPNVAAAVEAYTINAAFAMKQDDIVGSLKVGKLADLVVLNQNIFTVAPSQIDATTVSLTLLGGDVVHGTTLSVNIAAASVAEGGSTTATVSRIGDTTSALTATLTSSDTGEATVPATVTIAAGQSTSPAFTISGATDSTVDGTQQVTVTATAAGSVSGIDTIGVTDVDSAIPGRPVLDSQPLILPGSRPTVTWDAVANAARYEVWVSKIVPLEGRILPTESAVTSTTWTPSNDLDAGFYRVWVRAVNDGDVPGAWSVAEGFNVRPTLIAPLTSSFNPRPEFTWNAVPGVTAYQVFVRTSAGDIVTSDVTSAAWTPTQDLPSGNIRWWIRATDSPRHLWSSPGTTRIDGQARVLSPTGSLNQTQPVFQWQPVSGAGRYVLHVQNVDTGAVTIRENNLTGTSYIPNTALAQANYRVWVKAIDGSTNSFATGVWSQGVSFSITSMLHDDGDENNYLQELEAPLAPKIAGLPAQQHQDHEGDTVRARSGPTGSGRAHETREQESADTAVIDQAIVDWVSNA